MNIQHVLHLILHTAVSFILFLKTHFKTYCVFFFFYFKANNDCWLMHTKMTDIIKRLKEKREKKKRLPMSGTSSYWDRESQSGVEHSEQTQSSTVFQSWKMVKRSNLFYCHNEKSLWLLQNPMNTSSEQKRSWQKNPASFFPLLVLPVVVEECRRRLLAAGFIELKETEQWDIKPSSKVGQGFWFLCKSSWE